MISDAPEHVAKVGFRIDPVELARFHQTIDGRGARAAGVRAHEHEVLAAQAHTAQCALSCVVVDLDAPVVAVARQ